MIRNMMLEAASITLLSMPAPAAPCRDAKGKFVDRRRSGTLRIYGTTL